MPGRLMSNVYLARPVTFSGPSSRVTGVPSTVLAEGQLYFGSAGGCWGWPAPPPCTRVAFGLATGHPLHARDRLEDARESPAPADVPVEPAPNLLRRWRRGLFEQRHTRHDEPGGAEAAHQRVLLAERLLHRVERGAAREPVDIANLLALHVDRECRAGIDRPAVDDHRARAAGAAIAAALVAGQVGAHPKRVEQRDPWLDHEVQRFPVDVQADRDLSRTDNPGGGALRLEFGRRCRGGDRADHTC